MTVKCLFLLPLLFGSRFVVMGFTDGEPPYDMCNRTQYYSSLISKSGSDASKWSKQDVIDLITITHRKVLDNVALKENGDDIIMALKDLWKRGQDSVRDIYRDIDFPANLANTQLGWEKEDLWPRGRGWKAPQNQEAWTDIYGKAPVDATVRVAKRDLFFGTCGRVENRSKCVTPATTETANSTETDGKVWAPPDSMKGDVARALFYFAARYQTTLNLTLTDCPPFKISDFAYLSQLLEWHDQDPPSAEEIFRNDRGCTRWQGNRNPFVDYPALVSQVFYPQGADQVIPGAYKYSRCTAPTSAPTATPNDCADIKPGDVPIFLLNSLDVDQVVFFPLENIRESVGTLYLTDNPWNGTAILKQEGTFEFEIPSDGIKAGSIFGMGDNSPLADRWKLVKGDDKFDINTNVGDNLFLYCIDADDKPHFITGWSNAGPWINPGLPDEKYLTAFSALPSELQSRGSIFMDHLNNCVYIGPIKEVPKNQLAALFIDPRNFDCINTPRIQLNAEQSASTTINKFRFLSIVLLALHFSVATVGWF